MGRIANIPGSKYCKPNYKHGKFMYLRITKRLNLQQSHLLPIIQICFFTLFLSGCTSIYKPDTPQITLHLTTSNQLSSINNNLHQPTAVKIYELKGSAIFKYADYLTLHNFAEETLASDFISKQELKLMPNSEKVLTITPNDQTKYIAVITSHKGNRNATWRQIKSIHSFKNKHQYFVFSKNGISLLDNELVNEEPNRLSLLNNSSM